MQKVKSYSEPKAKISLPSSYLRSCVGVLQAVVVVTDVIEIAIIFCLHINKSSNNNRTNSIDTFILGLDKALNIDLFPAFHHICCLHLFCLHILWWPILQTYGPRPDCSFRSSLIRVHSVCFHDKISLECI